MTGVQTCALPICAGSFGPMNEVIVNSTSQMTDADLRAMAVYLKSLGAVDIGGAVELSGRARGAGETLYTIHCGTCHLPTGLGSTPGQDLGPPLAGSAVAQAPDPASLINIILYGSQVVRPTPPKAWKNMKPLYDALDDEEVAAVANLRAPTPNPHPLPGIDMLQSRTSVPTGHRLDAVSVEIEHQQTQGRGRGDHMCPADAIRTYLRVLPQ